MRSGVQKRMRCVIFNVLYINNCHCHKLQLVAVYSANEHMKGNEFKCPSNCMERFPLFNQRAEILAEIEAVLNNPEVKATKHSDTQWLARERCIQAVRQVFPTIIKLSKTFMLILKHMASLYSSALTSLLLACTCFVMFFIQ